MNCARRQAQYGGFFCSGALREGEREQAGPSDIVPKSQPAECGASECSELEAELKAYVVEGLSLVQFQV